MLHPLPRLLVQLSFSLLLACGAVAQTTFPDKPVRIIAPLPPGSSTDAFVRIMADELSKKWGQSVVVENRPGGNSVVATQMVARAPADGYTLLAAALAHALNPSLNSSLPYDSIRDFTPIVKVVELTNSIVVHSSVPAKSMSELIEYARANPGKVVWGNGAQGTTQHLIGLLLQGGTNIEFLEVPYGGSTLVDQDLLTGRIQLYIGGVAQVAKHLQSQQIRMLAVTSKQRIPSLPDVPTMTELGMSHLAATSWLGFIGPAKMPPAIVQKINTDIRQLVADPRVQQRLVNLGFLVDTNTPAEFDQQLRDEVVRWGEVMKKSTLKR